MLELIAPVITIDQPQDIGTYVQCAPDPIILVIEPGRGMFCGLIQGPIYGYRIGIETPGLGEVIRDFQDYESAQGRTPLVFILRGLSLPAPLATAAENSVLPDWVVHSTDADAAESILRTGCLHSARRLQHLGIVFRPFGRAVLSEPADYYNLINLAPAEGYGPEIVVASKQQGRFCSEKDSYHPGVQFYFNVPILRKKPGYVRFMGGHALRGSICLDLVTHYVVRATDLTTMASWTPELFTNSANQLFRDFSRTD